MLNKGHICSYLKSSSSGHNLFIAFYFIGVYSIVLLYKWFQLIFDKAGYLAHNLKE